MRTKLPVGLGLVAMLFGGCVVQCIQPLFSEREYAAYPALVGTWEQREDDGKAVGTWIFEEDERQYILTHTDEKGQKASFHVAVGNIGANTFLDLSLKDPSPGRELNDLATVTLIGVHAFAQVAKTNDALVLRTMNYEWLESHFKTNSNAVSHIIQNERVILTASTRELQAFVGKYANDREAFKNEIKLQRRKKS
jgi:hypothetical protein